MELTPSTCGVIATIIPVYLLVLVAGRSRLLRPYSVGWMAVVLNVETAVVAVLGTAAEATALWSVIFGTTITNATAQVVVFSGTITPVVLTGVALVLQIFAPIPDAPQQQ